MAKPTDDLRILQTRPLIAPAILQEEIAVTSEIESLITTTRDDIHRILVCEDQRQLVIVGPCSIHDPAASFEYGTRLREVRDRLKSKLLIVMRAYFEKPRTTVGWKGFINDPDLDESFAINKGLRSARTLLRDLNALGVPTASEFLDLQIPQHVADLTSWVAIGARTTESQVHRELASGLSMPVGFKNTTEGNVQAAVDAVLAARRSHWFPSVTKGSVSAIFQTTGNEDCHVILRGGSRYGPNYDAESVAKAAEMLRVNGLPTKLMVDCSHGNSHKDFRRQSVVLQSIMDQLRSGSNYILGVMLESNLIEGRQDEPETYGQSITDSCLGWDETERLLEQLAEVVA